MHKSHFITYSDDNKEKKGQYKDIHLAKKRILEEAYKSQFFDSIKGYSYYDLTSNFKEKYNDLLIQSRGAGYWCWKINIIKQRLDEIDNGDFLIYADAGCTINPNGGDRLNEYKDILNKSDFGIIYHEMESDKNQLKIYSTKEVFNYFKENINGKLGKRRSCTAGILIMQKKPHLYTIINAFENVLDYDKYLITDKYNSNPQCKDFKGHRHDQSIFTILFIKYGAVHINRDDFNYRVKKSKKKNKKFYDKNSPFWATRIRR